MTPPVDFRRDGHCQPCFLEVRGSMQIFCLWWATRDFSITSLLTYTHYCKHRVAPSPHSEQTYLYKGSLCPSTEAPLYASWLACFRARLNIGSCRARLDDLILVTLIETVSLYAFIEARLFYCHFKHSVPCACLSQITATSSKVTTISNWKTAAWRSSSWVRSQRTGSVVEHFQKCLATERHLASWGHCHSIAHNLRSPQCTLL